MTKSCFVSVMAFSISLILLKISSLLEGSLYLMTPKLSQTLLSFVIKTPAVSTTQMKAVLAGALESYYSLGMLKV